MKPLRYLLEEPLDLAEMFLIFIVLLSPHARRPVGRTRRSEGEPSTTALRLRRWISLRGEIDDLIVACPCKEACARARHFPVIERLTRTR